MIENQNVTNEVKKEKGKLLTDTRFMEKVPNDLREEWKKFLEQKEEKVPVQVRIKKSMHKNWKKFVKRNKKNIPTVAQLIREAVEYYISLDGTEHPFANILQKSWLLRRIVVNLMFRIKEKDDFQSNFLLKDCDKFSEIANNLLNLILSIQEYEDKNKLIRKHKKNSLS